LGLEVYGSPLLYTWLDRDLGLAGRLLLKSLDDRLQEQLINIAEPILRIPSLAIHLNREIHTEGLKINAQAHLAPVLAIGDTSLRKILSERSDVEAAQILSWDLSLYDLAAPTLGGYRNEFVFAPRLDNQAMCHASITAIMQSDKALSKATQIVCLYNHEEVGSASYSGADGSFAQDVLKRICESEGPKAQAATLPRACALSLHISADMAHAIHPNYNQGPVIKTNASQRYATSGETAALFELICQDAGVPYQKFVNRNDMACGSTIGPIAATRLGIKTVDVGNPMLSMHSIREQAGAHDHDLMINVMTRFLGG
jgi:aspartyl aminopeptidase